VAVALAVLALSAPVTTAPARAAENPVAPAFSIRGLDGRTVRLSDLKGQPVVLDFWATWCAPCKASMPHLSGMQERYASKGLVVLGVSVDDAEPQVVRQFAEKLGVRFRIALANEDILDAYGPIRSIPTTFFINRKGEVVRRVVGYIDRETMESYVRELL
jgi:thiol-disulfide isomerase/thioredoxin